MSKSKTIVLNAIKPKEFHLGGETSALSKTKTGQFNEDTRSLLASMHDIPDSGKLKLQRCNTFKAKKTTDQRSKQTDANKTNDKSGSVLRKTFNA